MKLEFNRDSTSKQWQIDTIQEPSDKFSGRVQFSGYQVSYPANIAAGTNSYHKLDNDIELVTCDLTFKVPVSLERKATQETEFYSLHINCNSLQLWDSLDSMNSKPVGSSNSSMFWLASDVPSCVKIGTGETLRGIIVYMSKEFLQNVLAGMPLPSIDAHGQILVDTNEEKKMLFGQRHIISQRMQCTIGEIKQELIQEILNFQQSDSIHEKLLLKANILKILALFIKRISSKNQRKEKYASFSDAAKIFEVKKLIDDNAGSEHITLSYLARATAISKTTLKTKFKEIIGKTTYQYYLDVKMQKAKSILEDCSVPITDLSYELGFKSASHFCQIFKKYYGVSPKSVRSNFV